MAASGDLLRALMRSTVRPVTVCGELMHVRSLSGAERVQFQKWTNEPDADQRLVWLGLCNADGARLPEFEEFDNVAALPVQALGLLTTAVLEASGLGKGADEAAEKN